MTTFRNRYALRDRLGEGGMAEVYRAERVGTWPPASVAIKRVRAGFSADPRFVELFEKEASVAIALVSPHVIRTEEYLRDEAGRLCLVMEYVDGVDLARLLALGALPVPETVHVVEGILQALDYAHRFVLPGQEGSMQGLVHRDVSPNNVLVSRDGEVKLIDFGIARAMDVATDAETVTVRGKPGYLSPEQLFLGRIDARSDLFSLGVMLHELLTGARLFPMRGMAEYGRDLVEKVLQPPGKLVAGVPPELDALCLALLDRDRNLRIPTAAQALERLTSLTVDREAARRSLAERIARDLPPGSVVAPVADKKRETMVMDGPAARAPVGEAVVVESRPTASPAGAGAARQGIEIKATRIPVSSTDPTLLAGSISTADVQRALAERAASVAVEPRGERGPAIDPASRPAFGEDAATVRPDEGLNPPAPSRWPIIAAVVVAVVLAVLVSRLI